MPAIQESWISGMFVSVLYHLSFNYTELMFCKWELKL